VQLGIDTGKHVAWPIYLVTLRAEYDCPVALVVFAVDPAVQRWARQTIDLGHPGFRLTPLVVGPDEIPRITDPAEARAAPYRAILSALVHALEPGAEQLVVAAFEGADTLPGEDADTWRELLHHAIQNNEVARLAVEALMDIQDFRDKSVWFKEGREAGLRAAIERVLLRRGLDLATAQRAQLEACHDLPTLERWHDQAITAASAGEALG
jgi:hypothetical protein